MDGLAPCLMQRRYTDIDFSDRRIWSADPFLDLPSRISSYYLGAYLSFYWKDIRPGPEHKRCDGPYIHLASLVVSRPAIVMNLLCVDQLECVDQFEEEEYEIASEYFSNITEAMSMPRITPKKFDNVCRERE